ncbi:MAG: hemerythrin family protein [Magnetococcales bacterium]|nr:hemerythrin family protein [Magnetococcales bacterium]
MSIKLVQLPEQYRLGHKYIDGQHEILFQLFKELSEYCKDTEYDIELEIILLSLKTYVDTHFRYEENLMESLGYINIETHKLEHSKLEKQVVEKFDKFSTLSNKDEMMVFALDLKGFLMHWLLEHIAETDRTFCETLN